MAQGKTNTDPFAALGTEVGRTTPPTRSEGATATEAPTPPKDDSFESFASPASETRNPTPQGDPFSGFAKKAPTFDEKAGAFGRQATGAALEGGPISPPRS